MIITFKDSPNATSEQSSYFLWQTAWKIPLQRMSASAPIAHGMRTPNTCPAINKLMHSSSVFQRAKEKKD